MRDGKRCVMIAGPMLTADGTLMTMSAKELTEHAASCRLLEQGYCVTGLSTYVSANELMLAAARGVRDMRIFVLGKLLEQLAGCECLYLLEGWEKDPQCVILRQAASWCGLDIMTE